MRTSMADGMTSLYVYILGRFTRLSSRSDNLVCLPYD